MCVGILSTDPVSGFLAVLVFKPSVRINDLHTMDHLFDVVLASSRRLVIFRGGPTNEAYDGKCYEQDSQRNNRGKGALMRHFTPLVPLLTWAGVGRERNLLLAF